MNNPNQQIYRHSITGRQYLLVDEKDGTCYLEPMDRRVIKVKREIIDDIRSVWERTV